MMADLSLRDTILVDILQCRQCGNLDPGPRDLCAICHADNLEVNSVPGTGQLVSWTVIRRAPMRFKELAPYAIAVVDLDAGVRVTGRLRGNVDGLQLGAAVNAVAQEDGAYLFERPEA